MRFQADELREVQILEGLADWQIAWFRDHGDKIDLAAGDHLFEAGQPADFMFVIVRGAIQRFEMIGGAPVVVATTRHGDVTGMLPYSRMTQYPGYTVALEPSQILRLRKSDFPEMLAMCPEMGRRLVAVMSDRVRGDVRQEQQRERLVALGRLSAGLAHELNNPAAAVRRTAANLSDQLAKLRLETLRLLQHATDVSTMQAIEEMQRQIRDGAAPVRSAVERSRFEETFAEWLQDLGVSDAWEVASFYADSGVEVDALRRLAAGIPAEALPDVLVWVGRSESVDRMLSEITSSATRISDLVGAVKSYSHMDRSPDHKPTDVREGLDSTLTMLSHKIKQKTVGLTRDYEDGLPEVLGNAGELNQVWTNLLDNAIDALDEGGHLEVHACREEDIVCVRIADDGHGIPEEIRDRIFDPFFTTKNVGEGTGLGLDIALRVVRMHRGSIEVQSEQGRTEVVVRLPPASGPE